LFHQITSSLYRSTGFFIRITCQPL